MRREELLNRYSAGERDFSGKVFSRINLEGANLSRANFRGAKFYRCELSRVNFSGADMERVEIQCQQMEKANLSCANLSHANLSSSNLSNANLTHANLSYADLLRTDFSNADLRNAILKDAFLSANNSSYGQAKLSHANLSSLDLSGISLARIDLGHANLSNANLSNANLASANLSNVNLTEANLENANFSSYFLKDEYITRLSSITTSYNSYLGANLNDANLSNANLNGANLSDTNLCGTNFEGANLDGIDLSRANLKNTRISSLANLGNKYSLAWQILNQGLQEQDLQGVDLSRTNLNNVDLSNKNLTNASLNNASLIRINFSRANLRKVNFSNAVLSYANFSEADLKEANFNEANLDVADFTGANLASAILSGTKLVSANFSNANLNQANLKNAHLNAANMTNANLDAANLSFTNLKRTNFKNVNLSTVNLNGAKLSHADVSEALGIPDSKLSFSSPLPQANSALINELRETAAGLFHNSEGGHPYEIFLWDVATKGKFSFESLLLSIGNLKAIDINDFFINISNTNLNDTEKLARAYNYLLTQIQSHINNVELYELRTESLENSSSVMLYILLANTKSGDWLGISTIANFGQQGKSSSFFRVKDNAINKSQNIELVQILNNITSEINYLLPRSEATEGLVWEMGENREFVFQNLLISTKHLTIDEYREDFFQQECDDDVFGPRQSLADVVETNLTNLSLYRLGASRIDFYLMGEAENKDWIGIRTEVTWT